MEDKKPYFAWDPGMVIIPWWKRIWFRLIGKKIYHGKAFIAYQLKDGGIFIDG